MITNSNSIWVVLVEGAVGAAILCLSAFLLSRFRNDVAGRTALAIGLFTAAGAYFGFAVMAPVPRIWLFIELLQCIVFGVMGLAGWRGAAKWLALGWALHPIWDFGVHNVSPGDFAPWAYTIACLSFDWVVAAYIVVAYQVFRLGDQSPR